MKSIDITRNRARAGGCECQFFVKIINGKKVGLKVYWTARDAKFAFEKQKQLAKLNLAPKVLSERIYVLQYTDERPMQCGFLTEVARTDMPLSFNKGEQFANLRDNLAPLRMHRDLHSGNTGFVKRRGKWRMVLIDCGRWSSCR